MVREEFGVEPDTWQMEALSAFAREDQVRLRLSLQACAGPGKLQPKSMMLFTPDGLRRWGDIKVGDLVFAQDGSQTKVTRVSDNGIMPMYRVTFDDGSSTLAGAEHLWKVRGRTERRYFNWDKKSRPARSITYSKNNRTIQTTPDGYSILTTEQIISRNNSSDGKRRQFEIPIQGAVQFGAKALPLDPYILGVWLGDGSRNSARFTSADKEIADEIKRRGYKVSGPNKIAWGISGIGVSLRDLGLFSSYSYEKIIPLSYATASITQRTDLLRGLMDTDGTIGSDGHCEYTTSSENLAQDIVSLVRSLGGVSLIKSKVSRKSYKDKEGKRIWCRLCYRVTVSTPFNPFHLPRKAVRWKPVQARYLTRYVDKVEPAAPEDSMCIEIDHPSKCYLANDFIVTHNSAVLAWCGINFLMCYGEPGNHPKGAAVSVTADNLKDNLWPEFAKWIGVSRAISAALVWTKERVFARDHPETWFISARSWAKTANPEDQAKTLSGLHSNYVLALIDESGAIPLAVLKAADQALSTSTLKFGRIIQAGNPISLDGILYAAATRFRNLWEIIRITGDPDDPRRSSRIEEPWAREQIAAFGRDNPWVMAYILGQFPPASINTVLGIEEVNAALGKHLTEDVYSWAQKRLGIDVARFGDDRSVIFPRQGLAAFNPVVMRHQRTTDIAARVSQAKVKWGSEIEFVDDSGHWGHGVIDNLYAAGYSPIAVLGEAPAIDPRYKNKRAECWMAMAEWIRRGGALPNLPEIVAELTGPTYTFLNGKIIIEDKKLLKKRINVSPDLADALAYTFALPDQPATQFIHPLIREKSGLISDYDPFNARS